MLHGILGAMPPASTLPPSRSRLEDVARAAGVSKATVDRVLHARKGVRSATVQRVVKAAAQLHYLPDDNLHRIIRPRPMELVFLVPAGTNQFIQMLGDYVGLVEKQLEPFNVRCRRVAIEGFDPKGLAAALLRHGRRCDGIAFVPLEHARVRAAVDQLADAGVHVLTLLSDLADARRAAYVGVDNRAAGRTAGYLLGRMLGKTRGKVGLIAGSLAYRGHEEREAGFLQVLAERFPQLEVVGLREGHDDVEQNYRQASQLLQQHRELVGLYNIGGAAEGIGRALKELGLAQQLVFIGHEITPGTRALLADGTLDAVVTQNPQTEIMNCVRVFANLRAGRDALAGVEPVRAGIAVCENLP
ncbi:LacI family transcriptional regulator [Pseudorhodoferax soli]|uniref:LacI family transcriptional regulator n=2 Tax=Pseudorhodoferax soli TaxID=545864 RepID=A0A368XG40_9BURK|nr:LacI family transcriptional regulator [Pseudorhodoferax soli]